MSINFFDIKYLNNNVYYHGSSDSCGIQYLLLPPEETKFLQEEGRKKNLDQVFFTEDFGLAKVYAGRACNRFGGNPVIFRVIPMGEVVCLSSDKGATVYYSRWAFVERLIL